MRNELQRPTLTQLLRRTVFDYLDSTGTKKGAYATSVREHYERAVPEHAREVDFSAQKDAVARMARDTETVFRFLDPEHPNRAPLDLLESMIAALPSDWRFPLQQEMATRQDLLAVPMPHAEAGAAGVAFGEMMREIGEAISATSAMFPDGINRDDAPQAPNAIRQLEEAMAKMAAVKALIERDALGVEMAPVIPLEVNRRA